MAQTFLSLLNNVFNLMLENKLRKDIDDTLLEKLLTFIEKHKYQRCIIGNSISEEENFQNLLFDFIEELVAKTKVLDLINSVIESVAEKNEKFFIAIKTFSLRLLGLILESPKNLFPPDILLKYSIFKDKDNKIISDHVPSVQDALLFCLCCITKNLKGTMWFIENSMEKFVFSSFNSSSYYVRKSAANFFINFIKQWAPLDIQELQEKSYQKRHLTEYIQRNMSYILTNIHYYQSPKEVTFSECCIYVSKELLVLEDYESIMGDSLKLSQSIAECFMDLPNNDEFNTKLIEFFLAIHKKSSLPNEIITDSIKCLIIREDIKFSFKLASSYASIAWPTCYNPSDVKFFLLPIYVITDTPLDSCESFFHLDVYFIHQIVVKKMENKTDSKVLFMASLAALEKLVPLLNSEHQKDLALTLLKVVKIPELPLHKWHCSILEDRVMHHSFLDLFYAFIASNVHTSFIYEENDLVFQLIMEFLKKPSSDSNFLSQLLLLMKNLLISHETMKFDLNDADKESLIFVLCRMLLDNRETVVDSAILLAGQILSGEARSSWQKNVSKQSVHSIIWDFAVHGCHDGSVRSTALKVIINGCLELWCLDKIKSSKGVTEIDIAKILFDLTHDPDFYLQREALSCLFQWLKTKWYDLPSSCTEYLFSALVSAIKSLDLELKLISLDAWSWIMQNKFLLYDTSNLKEYVEQLTDSGFGLCFILALEDYDEAVKYKAADILHDLKSKFMSSGILKNSLVTTVNSEKTEDCQMTVELQTPTNGEKMKDVEVSVELQTPLTEEKKYEGIDIVMEISTSEQISNICRPPSLSDLYNFKQDYFPIDREHRKCPVSRFWNQLWSDDLVSIVQPTKMQDINCEIESLLNDIIAAEISKLSLVEETPDCY